MALSRALAAAALIVGLAGCAQGRDPTAGHGVTQERPRAPVATLGPDDGVPFVPPSGHASAKTAAGGVPAAGPADEATEPRGMQQPARR
jgi:hypothetical protein